jgi:uncharacterized protein YjbJ (UPF0337 family)
VKKGKAVRRPKLLLHSEEDKPMSYVETTTDVVGQTIEEIRQGIDALADSTKAPLEAASLDLQENAQCTIGQVKDAVTAALDSLSRCRTTDQLRGYANEAMGKTKLAVALATHSSALAVAGIVQQAIGELQKFIGEAKRIADGGEKE